MNGRERDAEQEKNGPKTGGLRREWRESHNLTEGY
jgi:hypothetical protein